MSKKKTRAVKWRPRRAGESDASWAAFLRKHHATTYARPGRKWVVRAVDKSGTSSNVGTFDGVIHELPGTVFDELAVDHWIHMEQLDTRTWSLGIGDHQLSIYIPRDGSPPVLRHYELGDLAKLIKGKP